MLLLKTSSKCNKIEHIANFYTEKQKHVVSWPWERKPQMWDLSMTCSKDYNKVEEIQPLKSALKIIFDIILYLFFYVFWTAHSTNRLDHSSYTVPTIILGYLTFFYHNITINPHGGE